MPPKRIVFMLYGVLNSDEARLDLWPLDKEGEVCEWLESVNRGYMWYTFDEKLTRLARRVSPDVIRYCRTNITPTMPAWEAWQAFEEGYL